MKRRCELCRNKARIHCASDQASLCWACDAHVHSANFLVARHSRSLLCHVCQAPTPWSATGADLPPTTASVCQRCVDRRQEVAKEEEEEQVVPPSQPPPESSSSGEEAAANRKRFRIGSDENESPSICKIKTTSLGNIQRTESDRVEARGSGILDSLRRLHREETGSGGDRAEICTLSGPSI